MYFGDGDFKTQESLVKNVVWILLKFGTNF